MIKGLAIVIAFALGLVWWQYRGVSPGEVNSSNDIVSTEPSMEVKWKTVQSGGEEFAYALIPVELNQRLLLVTNYSDKLSSQELMKKGNCTWGINGGFYNTDDSPIGLVVEEGEEVSKFKTNRLFNGVLWIDTNGRRGVTDQVPETTLQSAIQTGPVLINGGNTLDLAISSDKTARRMTAILEPSGKLNFLSVFKKDSTLDGPGLDALPKVVEDISRTENIDARFAINLDGGSASAIYSPQGVVRELSNVGSWWCVKE